MENIKISKYDKGYVRIYWKYERNHIHTWRIDFIDNFDKFITDHCYVVEVYEHRIQLIYDTTEGKLL